MEIQRGMTRRTVLLAGGASMASVLLASCTVGGSPKPTNGKSSALTAAFTQPIATLDPYLAGSTVDEPSLMARSLIFDTLVRRDGEKLKPSLAKSWDRPDDTTWVFTLQDGVAFHDGTKLTSKDVKAAMDYMRTHSTEQSPLWAPIANVEATGDDKVTVTTKIPMGSLLVNLPLLFIAPADSVGNTSAFKKPVASGRYTVSSFVPSSKLELKRAKKYWGTAGKSPEIDLPYIGETASAITSLRNGDVDLLWPIPPDQVKEAESDSVTIDRVPSWVYYFIWFNCSRKPFTDARVRQAMWHAVDIDSIVKDLFGKGAELMKAPIPSTVFGFAPQTPYDYDPDKAKSLLKQAGLADGFSSSMMWFDSTGPLATQFAQTLISGWSKVGVTVKPEKIQKADWVSRLNKLDWDMDLQTNTVSTGDADFTLGRLYTSKANRMGYKNPKLDQVLSDAGSATANSDKRKKLFGEACKIIWDDAVGIFPATIVTAYGQRKAVKGFTPAPSNQPDLSTVTV